MGSKVFNMPSFAPVRPLAMTGSRNPFGSQESEDATGAVTVVDESGRYVFANRAASALLGRPPAELLRAYVYDLDLRFADAADWQRYFQWLRQQDDRHYIAWGRRDGSNAAPIEAAASFLEFGPGYVLTVARQWRQAQAPRGPSAGLERMPGIFLTLADNGRVESMSGLHLAALGLTNQGELDLDAWAMFSKVPELCQLLQEAVAGAPQNREVAIGRQRFQVTAAPKPGGSGVWCVAVPCTASTAPNGVAPPRHATRAMRPLSSRMPTE
jgi:PAS domain-containing protein